MKSSAGRHAYLDWVRGVAVLIMIEAHVLDSWTVTADRSRALFGYAMILGGFGAPLFLFLAGVAVILSAESKFRKTGDFAAAWSATQKRGWQLFGLAFLFRLQSFILGGGHNAIGLLKVDILNIMGPGIAMAAILGQLSKQTTGRAFLLAVATCAIALLTPIIRIAPALAWLPDPLEWYFRPTSGRTNFTLFPWVGFVFAGGVAGVAIDRLRSAATARQLQVGLGVVGLTLAWVAHLASFQPSFYERSDYWTTSPSFFFLRVGLLTLLLPIGYVWEHAPFRHKFSTWSYLEEFGRASLFVYWIHVEMVYGLLSRPIRRALSLEGALVAYVLFTIFLVSLVRLKNWIVGERGIYLTDNKSVI